MKTNKTKFRELLVFLGLFLSFSLSFSQEYTKEQLDQLKKENLLTQEDYEILLSEIGEGNYQDKILYKLTINGKTYPEDYLVLKVGNELYLPLFSFFQNINFKNFSKKDDGTVIIRIGDSLKELVINPSKKRVEYDGNLKNGNFDEQVVLKDEEIFLNSKLFKEVFLDYLDIYDDTFDMKMALGFNAPETIDILLEKNERELEEKMQEKDLLYTNSPKFFELGNMRLQLAKKYSRESNFEKKSSSEITSSVEYQGTFLYGDFTTSYDFQNNTVGDTYIRYSDFIKEHDLQVSSYGVNKSSREWGVSLRKNKGYYEENKNYVIEDDVPIGSRVELLYLGTPIAIQDATNGQVKFENSEIKGDRTYQLKIYSPDGQITLKDINTAQTFNQQNKGEAEYNIDIRERHDAQKVGSKAEVFYGLTNNLTIGTKFKREPEEIKGNYEDIETGELEVIYSNYINKTYPYTLKLGGEKTLNSYITEDNKNLNKRYSYNGLIQVEIKKFKFTTEGKTYGEYHSEKDEVKFIGEYKPTDKLTLSYENKQRSYWDDKNENISTVSLDYDYKFKDLLVTTSLKKANKKSDDELNVNFYYSGFENYTINFENSIKGEDRNFESALKLYNNNFFGLIDYNLGIKYSEKQKERFVFEFTLRYDNFIKIDSTLGDKGTRELSVGLDTVIDLRNPTHRLSSIDSSNVNAITFVDGNDNNIYDIGEKKVKNVEIQIGEQKINTNEDGEAYFYGVPNDVLLDLKPTIRKPSYSLGNNKIKIKGKGTSTIEAYIPIKPMMTLAGIIEIDEELGLSTEEIAEVYNELIVKVLDKNGKVIELTMPDETGIFTVSGLFTDKYKIEMEYIGNRFNLPQFKDTINLAYNGNNQRTELVFEMNKRKIVLNKNNYGG